MGFTKLDERILQSSIMFESPTTFKVWITLLAACREDGISPVSSIYLSSVCHLPLSAIDKAIGILESPDPRSRSMNDDGIRIKRADGGYEVVNYFKYRDFSYSSNPESERKRRYRERLRDNSGRVPNVHGHSASASASASASFISLKEGPIQGIFVWGGIAEADESGWKKAYPACDINRELAAMLEWIKANPAKGKKSNYRRFIVNWLSRSQERGGGMRGISPGKFNPSREMTLREIMDAKKMSGEKKDD